MSLSIIPKLSFETLRMSWKFIPISPCLFLSFPNLASRRWISPCLFLSFPNLASRRWISPCLFLSFPNLASRRWISPCLFLSFPNLASRRWISPCLFLSFPNLALRRWISPCLFLLFPNLASRRWEWAGGENGEDQGAAGDHRLAPVQRGQADRAGWDPQGPSPRAGGQDRVLRVGGWTQRAGRALPAAGLPRPAGTGPGARDQAQVRGLVEIEPEYMRIIWELR